MDEELSNPAISKSIITMKQMKTFGGMQVGHYNIFQTGSKGRPELTPLAKRIGTMVLPAGATSRQELRYLLEEAKRSGRPYIEAPRTYTQGSREQDRYGRTKDPLGFYDEQGRRFSGTFLGGGSYGGHSAHGMAGYVETAKGPVKVGQNRGGYRKNRKSDETQTVDSVGQESQREQPSMETPEGYIRNRSGYLEKDYSEEGYEKDRYGYWQKKDVPKFPSK